jgi:cation transport ATPase
MLTGDNAGAAQTIAQETGVDESVRSSFPATKSRQSKWPLTITVFAPRSA